MQPGYLLPAALAATLAFNAPAGAATIERTEIMMAVSACQSALPVFYGVIRKRPLAVQNEGSAGAFITCGLEGVFYAAPHNSYVGIGLLNNGSATVTVNCTLVDGGSGFSNPEYLPDSATISPGAMQTISWYPEGEGFIYPAISCSLPPGTGITYVSRRFHEEIGS